MRFASACVVFLTALTAVAAHAQLTIEPVPGHVGLWNSHAISGNGKRVAFASHGNATGGNADGNHEIFVYDLESERLVQVTDTLASPGWYSNTGVSIDHSGNRVAFRSDFAVDGAGGELPGRDLFVADLDFNANSPVTRIRRVTYSGEQGISKLSANGAYLVFVSDTRVGGLNNDREVQLFRILLDPQPSVSNVTDVAGGIADHRSEVDFDADYDGLRVVFTSDRDLTGENPDGRRQIFLIAGGFSNPFSQLQQVALNPPGGWVRNPRVTYGTNIYEDYVLFESNGNPLGTNADGNFEIFRWRADDRLQQLTDTQGGEPPVGANRGLEIDHGGNLLVMSSNRDHVPANGTAPGNADESHEIFVGALTELVGAPPVSFTQVTASAPAAIENRFPKISSLVPPVVAFNSGTDLGVPGAETSLYVARLPATLGTGPPQLTGQPKQFIPFAGGPGVPVTIFGSGGFSSVESVQFGSLEALSFEVVTDERILAVAPPGVVEGPITLSSPAGSDTTDRNFKIAEFVVFGEEVNQGNPDYPGVAGKETLVRIFAGVESEEVVAAWAITNARLAVTPPSSSPVVLDPSMFSEVITDQRLNRSERSNVNFYVPGEALRSAGTYHFRAVLETVGQTVHDQTFTRDLSLTRDVTMFIQSLGDHPDQALWERILRGLELFTRLYPVRSGVGDLDGAIGASDFEAGLRVAYVNGPIEDDCYWEISESLAATLAAINSGGFEPTEFGVAFLPDGNIPLDDLPGRQPNCPWIDCETLDDPDVSNLVTDDGTPLNALGLTTPSQGTSWVLGCEDSATGVFGHESGHLLGLDDVFVPFEDPAFNLVQRREVGEPRSVMAYFGPVERLFVVESDHDAPDDYHEVFNRRRLTTQPSSVTAPPAPPAGTRRWGHQEHHEGRRFMLAGGLDADGVRVRYAGPIEEPGTVTPAATESELVLVLLDAAGNVIAEDRLPLPSMQQLASRKYRAKRDSRPFATVRPLPEATHAAELRRGGETVWRVGLSDNAPVVHLTEPARLKREGRDIMRIHWDGRDPDGDALYYQLEMSADPEAAWVPVVGGTTRTEATFDVRGLPGSKNLRFRVRASDGLRTDTSLATGPVIPDRTPKAAILSPLEGQRFLESEDVPFRGLAYDLEEGIVGAPDRYRWILAEEVAVTGRTVSHRFPPGPREVRLGVVDSTGKVGLDVVRFVVEADSDGDGLSDTDERIAGSDPNDRWSRVGVASTPRRVWEPFEIALLVLAVVVVVGLPLWRARRAPR